VDNRGPGPIRNDHGDDKPYPCIRVALPVAGATTHRQSSHRQSPMPINQDTLNAATREALRSFCSLLPTMVGEFSEIPRDEGIEFTISNPWIPDRPLTIHTNSEELTVCFSPSHYHVSDYGKGRVEAELIEEMILGIAAIIRGTSRAYSVHSGERVLGGGFTTGSSDEFSGGRWNRADRFVVCSWDGTGDRTVERPATP